MGTYYKIVCEDLREFIDPGKIAGGGRKFNEVLDGASANVVAYAMLTVWRGKFVRYVGDIGGDEGALYDSALGLSDSPWKDITEILVAEMIREE